MTGETGVLQNIHACGAENAILIASCIYVTMFVKILGKAILQQSTNETIYSYQCCADVYYL